MFVAQLSCSTLAFRAHSRGRRGGRDNQTRAFYFLYLLHTKSRRTASSRPQPLRLHAIIFITKQVFQLATVALSSCSMKFYRGRCRSGTTTYNTL